MKKKDQFEEETDSQMEVLIRPELNLEKWSFWQPAKSKNKLSEIVIQREMIQPDDSKLLAKVEITSNSKYGPLTTEDQKVWCALIKIWESLDRPRRLSFSRRKIAKSLSKVWCEDTLKSIETSLYRLRGTLFIWTDAFYNSNKQKTIKQINTFNILSDLKIAEERVDGHITSDACFCEFHELIYENLITGYSKPLLFDTLVSFDDGIAQIIYTHLDLVLSNNPIYERRTKELFESLQIRGEEYKKIYFRKRTLDRILPKLAGKQLSKGGFLKVTTSKTTDDKDYKLVAQRVQKAIETKSADVSTRGSNKEKDKGQLVLVEKELSLAERLVMYFCEAFQIKRKKPTLKEMARANELIAEYKLDFDNGKYIIDFSLVASKKTNFQIQTFGGVLLYADQAMADYTKHVKSKNSQRKGNEEKIGPTINLFEEDANYQQWLNNQIDKGIQAKSQDDMDVLVEEINKEIKSRFSAELKRWTPEMHEQFFQRMLRKRIATELRLESFDEWLNRKSGQTSVVML